MIEVEEESCQERHFNHPRDFELLARDETRELDASRQNFEFLMLQSLGDKLCSIWMVTRWFCIPEV